MTSKTQTKILLVDDLEENLIALEALLSSDDLVLLKARSGVEALELLLVNNVALALIDVQMPELDGFELAELMRGSERTSHVPIIFVTAGAQDPSRTFAGYDAGGVDFLYKPIEPRILRNKIRTFVELHVQRQLLSDQLRALQNGEAEARQLRDELAQTLRLNETFLGVVGHDLRNPLNTVLMSASLLQHLVTDTRQRSIIDRIGSATRQMARMIDDLYDLTRVRMGGGISISPRPDVDVEKLAERAAAELGAKYAGRPLHVKKAGDSVGVWDHDRLAQILGNLIGNALRHGTQDTPVEVSVDGTESDWVQLSVKNSGTIPAELLPHIFEPFRRHHTSHREGLGLGMFIVQQLVRAHGGGIEVTSQTDVTTVRIRLPRAPTSSAASTSSTSSTAR